MQRVFLLAVVCAPLAAFANNAGENAAWQFQTSTDKVNQAAIQDMIRKQKSGYYSAPVYNTTNNIGRQYNCNVSATSTGNDGNNSTVANSPSTAGSTSNASGNDSRTAVGTLGGATVGTSQANSGAVASGIVGGTSSQVQGAANQALNSTQGNTGAQTASVGGSSACAFGVLN
ncbi:hypothetical protein EJP69_27615 [Variovorax gossypii]|uniref:Uncharacterized protein n=1 Tax=Variovorax gossypii TaxID=1679495 RepID=A0A431TCZ6_9BURK|nr:hypothetical protein [Variovorax gossypii]MDP9607116.1 hypothetical protein [Variovorax paradoxus]RTQ30808.1 hypothetical protein EJP69_27615 [Variovorax gossypii]